MKILMLTPYVPYPPASGGQIRTFNLLKYLSIKNEITLVALYKNELEKKYISYLKPYCKAIYLCKRPEKPWQIKNILKSIFSFKPFLIVRNFSEEAQNIIKNLTKSEKYDVIHAETFYVMPHIPKTDVSTFLVEQTIEYNVYKHYVNSVPFFIRPFFYLDILKLIYWERYYWKKAFFIGTVSETDKRLISSILLEEKLVVIPNGAGDEMVVDKLNSSNLDNPILLFQGNFYWLQNTEAAYFLIDKIYPQLQKSISNIKVIIAGQNAENKIKSPNKNIEIIDIKTDDISTVKDIYQKSTIFLAPIFGPGGTRLKILAAMATGVPVIGTKVGFEGLEVKDNVHVLIAHTPQEFIDQINLILSDKKIYERIRENAYNLVKEKYSWKKIAQKLEIVYEKIKRHEDRN